MVSGDAKGHAMNTESKPAGSVISSHFRPPPAESTMEGFTRIGYTPQSAIADLIDNSIAAGATDVHISHIPKYGSNSVVYISDNGCGMNRDVLIQAMDYGSSKSLANSNLSVYGLGMKAASTSFSRKFTVLSRGESGEETAFSWDLDKQEQIGRNWMLDEVIPTRSHREMLQKIAKDGTGTVVMWDAAEMKLADPIQRQTVDSDRMIERINDNIKEHLSLIFHRIMSGESKKYRKLNIYFNNELLIPWNPFKSEYLLENWMHPEQTFEYTWVDKNGTQQSGGYSIQAFLLNPEEEGRREIREESRLEMNFQGVYTYREDRLIDRPGWLSFRATRHNSLNSLRMKFEIDSSLDSVLDLAVRKDYVVLPPEIFANLLPIYKTFSAEAEDRNRKRRKKNRLAKTPTNLHEESSKSIHKHREDIPMPLVERVNRNDVRVENQYGANVLRLREISQPSRPENFVIPVKNLDDGVLYEPLFNGTDITIHINQGHDFYQRVYLAFFDNPLAIEALDNVFWAFARAELNAAAQIRDQFVDMRHLVSSYLRRYAEDKNEPEINSDVESDDEAG